MCIGIEPGQSVGGCFVLAAYGRQTVCINPFATVSSIEKAIEMELNLQVREEIEVAVSSASFPIYNLALYIIVLIVLCITLGAHRKSYYWVVVV